MLDLIFFSQILLLFAIKIEFTITSDTDPLVATESGCAGKRQSCKSLALPLIQRYKQERFGEPLVGWRYDPICRLLYWVFVKYHWDLDVICHHNKDFNLSNIYTFQRLEPHWIGFYMIILTVLMLMQPVPVWNGWKLKRNKRKDSAMVDFFLVWDIQSILHYHSLWFTEKLISLLFFVNHGDESKVIFTMYEPGLPLVILGRISTWKR